MTLVDELVDAIERAGALLREARYAIALTGAGSSTSSGVPDFRSPGSGLWEQVNPMEVATIYNFRRHPEVFYEWIRPLVVRLMEAVPNAGHRALADLERGGWLQAVITQNIDDLHQRAGSQQVLEIHGHLREATCISCYSTVPTRALLDRFLQDTAVPRCAECGGVMKPNVVLFGEQLPAEVVGAAMVHVRRADLMLVAGSSLEVMPASHLPMLVHEQGGRLIVANLSPTYVDDVADVVIRGDVAEVLPCVVEACRGE